MFSGVVSRVGRIVTFYRNWVPNAPKNRFYQVFRRRKGYKKLKIRFFGFIKNTDPTPRLVRFHGSDT